MIMRRWLTPIVAFLAVAAAIVLAQTDAADATTLVDVLQVRPGSIVAEIGAGDGDLTLALAKQVGPSGQVLTSELGADRVRSLRSAIEKAGPTNVQVLEGHESRANLPDSCCDAIFMRNVYHHFGVPLEMNTSFLRALKPGGRIAIIDFSPPPKAGTAPAGQRREDGRHGVDAETVVKELEAAGFEILRSEERDKRTFIVVAAKPVR